MHIETIKFAPTPIFEGGGKQLPKNFIDSFLIIDLLKHKSVIYKCNFTNYASGFYKISFFILFLCSFTNFIIFEN